LLIRNLMVDPDGSSAKSQPARQRSRCVGATLGHHATRQGYEDQNLLLCATNLRGAGRHETEADRAHAHRLFTHEIAIASTHRDSIRFIAFYRLSAARATASIDRRAMEKIFCERDIDTYYFIMWHE